MLSTEEFQAGLGKRKKNAKEDDPALPLFATMIKQTQCLLAMESNKPVVPEGDALSAYFECVEKQVRALPELVQIRIQGDIDGAIRRARLEFLQPQPQPHTTLQAPQIQSAQAPAPAPERSIWSATAPPMMTI